MENESSGTEFVVWGVVAAVLGIAGVAIWMATGEFGLVVIVLGLAVLITGLKSILALGDILNKVGK